MNYKNNFKSILDFLLSFLLLPFIFLIIIIVSPFIYFLDKGSIFFNAIRLGKDGRPFKMYKFRTMIMNAPDIRLEDGSTFNSDDDPRLTKIGKILRKTSIDELPQFWNVLKGDMSIIGPRPHMLVHDEEYSLAIPQYSLRYSVKPGITGWAQVNGLRGERDLRRVKMRVEHDLWYIQNWTILIDLKIIIRTIGVMIKR